MSKDFNFLSSANLSLDDDDEEHLSVLLLFAKLEEKKHYLYHFQVENFNRVNHLYEDVWGAKVFKSVFFIEDL